MPPCLPLRVLPPPPPAAASSADTLRPGLEGKALSLDQQGVVYGPLLGGGGGGGGSEEGGGGEDLAPAALEMTALERLAFVASLWWITVPLFVVYVAEYSLQSGVWSAVGFPDPSSVHAREHFYAYANW